jgi:hypothetical protein
MFVPFRNSDKEVMIRRAKALFELLLPCLALAVVVFSFLPSRSLPIPTHGQVNEQAEGGKFRDSRHDEFDVQEACHLHNVGNVLSCELALLLRPSLCSSNHHRCNRVRSRIFSPGKFRRAWYVLRTGNEHPDWEKLGGDYFVASWERRGLNSSVAKEEARAAE